MLVFRGVGLTYITRHRNFNKMQAWQFCNRDPFGMVSLRGYLDVPGRKLVTG